MKRSPHKPIFQDRAFCSQLFLFIQRHTLIQPEERMLLAISGGIDSMVMLHFFQRFHEKFGIHYGVGHVDHQLRPDSEMDQLWLQAYCQEREIPFHSHVVNVPAIHDKGAQSSLEAVARECRYQWFHQLSKDLKYTKIATAHTASDQVELILMRLIRGSVQGLGGMHPIHSLQPPYWLIRPFLSLSRHQIEAYAEAYQVPFREDPSNQDLHFFRNRIRHHMMPLLRAENQGIESQINRLCDAIQDENHYLNERVKEWYNQEVGNSRSGETIIISILSFQALHPALQRRVICMALENWQGSWKIFTSRHIEAIRNLSLSDKGKQVCLPGGLQVIKKDNQLILCDNPV